LPSILLLDILLAVIKVLFKTVSGLFITISGFYIVYMYLQSLDDTPKPWMFGASLLLISAGVFLLVAAGRSNESIAMIPAKDAPDITSNPSAGFAGVLERNNAMAAELSSTITTSGNAQILESSSGEKLVS